MKWIIHPLVLGWIEVPKNLLTAGLDAGLQIRIPYLGFFLTNGKARIMVDNGINSRYIVDGRAWAGMPTEGGEDCITSEFNRLKIDPAEISTVIYTHLHNDHAGNAHLFPNATHVFQHEEWRELVDPLPSMKIRGDYDQSVIEVFKNLTCQRVVGDVEYEDGIHLLLTPGHTAGSQCIAVETEAGKYLLAGDTIHIRHIAYGYLREMEMMDGARISVTPAPKEWDEIAHSSLVYDHYAWYKSIFRIRSIFKDPHYVLTGHGPYLVNKVFG
ncbi:MAG: N-acyl homoserine lactonase family protein [Bacillota bacterium]|nr:N-acyl homoserine lactonase family protein [Bacillota bacterium]MDW7682657.1 N-acyl homoserine lactonase family protein [Bacillota bacterium]